VRRLLRGRARDVSKFVRAGLRLAFRQQQDVCNYRQIGHDLRRPAKLLTVYPARPAIQAERSPIARQKTEPFGTVWRRLGWDRVKWRYGCPKRQLTAVTGTCLPAVTVQVICGPPEMPRCYRAARCPSNAVTGCASEPVRGGFQGRLLGGEAVVAK
jgi:hypothetical protein